ncbi:MAG: type IV pilus biogenesis/stability protein PilW [Gammaproteobacteria bacterium]|jgi:type IV pilus assembly protein PilF
MRTTTGLVVLMALALSACAAMTERENPRVNKELAAQANTQLGLTYMQEGNYEMANLKLEKALELQPDRAQTHEAIAILYEQVGETAKAEKHYKRTLELTPDYARGHNNYGQFLCTAGRYQEAEKEFLLAANNAFYPVPSMPLTNAGLCALRIPDMDRAEGFFRQALAKDPGFAPALLQMGLISFSKGNYMSTRGYIQRYQEVAPHTAETLWLAIRTEYALGDHRAWGNYAMMLGNSFPDSNEVRILKKWENERRNRK